MIYLMSDKGVCRTAPATPGLFNINRRSLLCIINKSLLKKKVRRETKIEDV